jgi:hypothetical protein
MSMEAWVWAWAWAQHGMTLYGMSMKEWKHGMEHEHVMEERSKHEHGTWAMSNELISMEHQTWNSRHKNMKLMKLITHDLWPANLYGSLWRMFMKHETMILWNTIKHETKTWNYKHRDMKHGNMKQWNGLWRDMTAYGNMKHIMKHEMKYEAVWKHKHGAWGRTWKRWRNMTLWRMTHETWRMKHETWNIVWRMKHKTWSDETWTYEAIELGNMEHKTWYGNMELWEQWYGNMKLMETWNIMGHMIYETWKRWRMAYEAYGLMETWSLWNINMKAMKHDYWHDL